MKVKTSDIIECSGSSDTLIFFVENDSYGLGMLVGSGLDFTEVLSTVDFAVVFEKRESRRSFFFILNAFESKLLDVALFLRARLGLDFFYLFLLPLILKVFAI